MTSKIIANKEWAKKDRWLEIDIWNDGDISIKCENDLDIAVYVLDPAEVNELIELLKNVPIDNE